MAELSPHRESPRADEGLFAPDGWLRRISAEPALLFGGGRALLLEVAHPLVAAGVAQHSDFRADPYGRLRRTLDAMGRIAFGDRASALAAARGVERAHGRVVGRLVRDAGPFRAGTPYSGRDPELVRWVWATLLDTSLGVYGRFVGALSDEALEAYYADQVVIARLLGVPPDLLPSGYAAFRDYFDDMIDGGTLSVTPEARDIADAVLRPPGGGAELSIVRRITAGLLPASLREAFGLPWDADRAARFEALVASVRRLRAEREAGGVDSRGVPR